MELDLFKNIDDISEEDLHPKFKLLRDKYFLKNEKKILLNWTDGFIDRDNKIVKEFQTTFHSSFWEFYLYKVFNEMNFEIDFSHDRPDFIIKKPNELLIEAVVSNIKKDGRAESTRNAEDLASMIVPPHLQEDFYEFLNESIVRNSNAILSKNLKYTEKYLKCDWVKAEIPFIIALSSYGQVNYGREYYYPLLALLYGLYYNAEKKDFEVIEKITKPGTDSSIPIGLFNDTSFEHISAIIFSCTTTLGKLTSLSLSKNDSSLQTNRLINIRNDYEPPFYKIQDVSVDNPEELSDGLFIFHNPFAKNKISLEQFSNSNIFQITFEERKLMFASENLPIVSRLNMPKFYFSDYLLHAINKDFNG
jgi:hypothetical protein